MYNRNGMVRTFLTMAADSMTTYVCVLTPHPPSHYTPPPATYRWDLEKSKNADNQWTAEGAPEERVLPSESAQASALIQYCSSCRTKTKRANKSRFTTTTTIDLARPRVKKYEKWSWSFQNFDLYPDLFHLKIKIKNCAFWSWSSGFSHQKQDQLISITILSSWSFIDLDLQLERSLS